MPLNFTPKGKSNPTAPAPVAQPTARPQVNYGQPKVSTARAEALKVKLNNQPKTVPNATTPGSPPNPRRAGSTARAEQYAALPRQGVTSNQPQINQAQPRNVDLDGRDLSRIAPPPSGLADPTALSGQQPGQQLGQLDKGVGGLASAEATSEPLSPQFVALAKQERANRKALLELKAAQDAWKQERAGYVSKNDLTSDPLKALTEAGVTYDRLVELQLNQAAPDPNQALLAKIEELENKLAGVDEKFVTRDKQAYDAAVNQIRNDIKLLVDSDASFETIKATEQSEEVVDLIRKVFDAEGTVLTVEEACQLVEDKLVDREAKYLDRLTKLSKIKARLTPPAETPEEANPTAATAPNTTLTNQGAVNRPLTARERAILAVERTKAG